jgi:hypothetical protein
MTDRPVGAGTTLALGYGFFALASGARATVQITTRFDEAPVAYGLSAVAAAIYLLGAVLMWSADRGRLYRMARRMCWVELAGVGLVGGLSVAVPAWFPDESVWSSFGRGYGWIPAVLPIVALVWLHRRPRPRPPARSVPRRSDSLSDIAVTEREAGVEQGLGTHPQ